MKATLPVCCRPKAFALMKKQMQHIESPDALLEGAVAISMHQVSESDVGTVDDRIQDYSRIIRKKVRGCQDQALVAHLHEFLFVDQEFKGNKEDYYNPMNSYLPVIINTRQGSPVSLCLLYKLVAQRLGLRVHGVGIPGHFLVGIETSKPVGDVRQRMLIDPYGGGQEITPEEAKESLEAGMGEEFEWSDRMLKPITNLEWLTRIAQNLIEIFAQKQLYAEVAAMIELEMLMWPKLTHLQRDLALVLARADLNQPALAWMTKYLQANPDDPQKADLLELIKMLGQ